MEGPSIEGARCAQHPNVQASFVCARCGDFTCADCRGDAPAQCLKCSPRVRPVQYHLVSTRAFVLLSLASFGVYPAWWGYKNWRYIKLRDGNTSWPALRGLFVRITYWGLVDDIVGTSLMKHGPEAGRQHTLARLSAGARVGLCVGYFFVSAMDRLPDPYWLLGSVSFVFVLPAVRSIQQLNALHGHRARDWGLTWWQWIVTGLCLLLLLLAIVGLLLDPVPEEV